MRARVARQPSLQPYFLALLGLESIGQATGLMVFPSSSPAPLPAPRTPLREISPGATNSAPAAPSPVSRPATDAALASQPLMVTPGHAMIAHKPAPASQPAGGSDSSISSSSWNSMDPQKVKKCMRTIKKSVQTVQKELAASVQKFQSARPASEGLQQSDVKALAEGVAFQLHPQFDKLATKSHVTAEAKVRAARPAHTSRLSRRAAPGRTAPPILCRGRRRRLGRTTMPTPRT